jgi:hypothetical protein
LKSRFKGQRFSQIKGIQAMAAPTYSAGSYGCVINAVSVTHGSNTAALVDLSTKLGGALLCKILTAATAITTATTFSLYRITCATASGNTTLSGNASAGATSLTVNSATGISKNCIIAVVTAGGLVGEIVTVSNVSGTTLTVTATINAYSTNDLVFLIEQTATATCAPGGSWAANTEYSQSLYPPAAFLWIIAAKNADSTQSVTVTVNLDTNPAFS